jgi:tryptophanase
MDFVIETFEKIAGQAKELRGFQITYAPPLLRHFVAEFATL